MGFDRRTFLQRAGLALLTLGASQTGLPSLANRYYQALAAPTHRKLALLIGINNYLPGTNLAGCATDVELQRDLLIHRFGFQPEDILTLTDTQATRTAIETAFVEHLIKQAIATDVVIFHFSGYGGRVKRPQSLVADESPTTDTLINSLVASESTQSLSKSNDLLEETLLLLGRSLATEQVTLVLDTSHHSTGKILQGNLRVRSFPTLSEAPSPDELAFGEKLKAQIRASKSALQRTPTRPNPGMILCATQAHQIAAEATWNGFSAGLFTYALTQYLWQVTPPSKVLATLTRTVEQIEPLMGKQQQPQLLREGKQPLLTYFLLPETPTGAEGVVTAIEDKDIVVLKLAGLPAEILENYGKNSEFRIQNSEGIILRIRSREGLIAKARLIETPGTDIAPIQVGQGIQEYIRVLPRNLGLTIALDTSLERIERVDATSAFSSIPAVGSVVVAGEQGADCLLARVKETAPLKGSNSSANPDPLFPKNQVPETVLGSYGLFSAGGVLIPNTADMTNEAVKSAIQRLVPQFKKLLAAKLWRLTRNGESSRLGVRATLEKVEQIIQPLRRRETTRPGTMDSV
ncbi:MAG: caspase family protein, partial [Microcystaceae cyanobacterium]